MKISPIILSLAAVAGQASGALITHYTMEETSSPIIDQIGGGVATAVDTGHQYGVAGPAGFGNAAGLNTNGSWQLSPTDSAQLSALTNDFTVAAWIYIDSSITKAGANSNNNRIIGDDVAWDGDAWSFGVRDNALLLTKNGVVDAFSSGGASVPNDQWVHVAVTASSANGLNFYLNGALDGTNGNTANNNVGDDIFAIGRSYGIGEGQYFAGSLDEIRVYDSVLSGAEISALAVPEPSTGLLAALAGLALGLRRSRS
jgi:hypothetical protein